MSIVHYDSFCDECQFVTSTACNCQWVKSTDINIRIPKCNTCSEEKEWVHNSAPVYHSSMEGASKGLGKWRGLVTKDGDKLGILLSFLAAASFSMLLDNEQTKNGLL